jgi:hypothetical protein
MDIHGKRTFAVWGISLTLSYRGRHDKMTIADLDFQTEMIIADLDFQTEMTIADF